MLALQTLKYKTIITLSFFFISDNNKIKLEFKFTEWNLYYRKIYSTISRITMQCY